MSPFLLALMTMQGCDTLGPKAALFIPILEKFNEEWAVIDMECEQPFPSRKPKECVSRTLKCGDEIRGNNKMGNRLWEDDFYRRATCFSISNEGGHGGPEMVYKLKVPRKTTAKAVLVSDCEDLNVFAMRWNDRELECPKLAHAARVGECQADRTPRGGKVTMVSTEREENYLIAVDGKGGAVGNYHLRIECSGF